MISHGHANRIRKYGTRVIRGAIFALCGSLFSNLATSQGVSTPEYIATMSEFEVRALSGTYAPLNGNVSIDSVTPGEWLTNDPGVVGLAGIIVAWSGGAKGVSGSKLFVHGGGHNDSANNGLYIFDFSGTNKPTGWTVPSISTVSSVRIGGTYADGNPAAAHTYDGMVYAHHNDHVYRFAGAIWNPSGASTRVAWKYSVATNNWTMLPEQPGQVNTVGAIYDSNSGKIAVSFGGQFQAAFFRTSDETWSSLKSTGSGFWGGDATGAYDPTRRRGIQVGSGESRLIDFNWAAETLSVRDLSATGETELLSIGAPSAVYDAARDSFWIFGGPSNSPGWQNIYEMNASTFEIQRWPLSGNPILAQAGSHGSYGRYVFMPEWRAIGIVASHSSPAYVIRLPAGEITARKIPEPPLNLSTE